MKRRMLNFLCRVPDAVRYFRASSGSARTVVQGWTAATANGLVTQRIRGREETAQSPPGHECMDVAPPLNFDDSNEGRA